MRISLGLLSMVLCAALLLPGGCSKKRNLEALAPSSSAAAPAAVSPSPAPVAATQAQEKDPDAGQGGIPRIWTREVRERMLKNVVLAYHNYYSSNNRAPSKASDLADYYERDAKITEALEKGWFKFYYNVMPNQMTNGTSNTILVYENEPSRLGRRLVGMADGSVREVSQQEFDQMPKAGK
jgi:hypothetical protein